MTRLMVNRPARWLALGAGLLDAGAGLGLGLWPAETLRRMGAAVPGAEGLVMVRFVGAFVTAVGASYLLALAGGAGGRLRAVFEFTILFRLAAGTYCAVAVGLGWLGEAWLTVMATDYALVIAQAWLLAKGAGRGD